MQNYDDLLKKDCPMCGHKASVTVNKTENGYEGKVICNTCHLTLPSVVFDTEEKAINALVDRWNKKRQNDPIHAHWIEEPCGDSVFDHRFTCTNCHGATPDGAFPISPDFCPYCGAIMDEVESPKDPEIYAVDIKWDIDGVVDHDNADLKSEMFIPDDIVSDPTNKDHMYKEISEYISDVTGFAHKGFSIIMK